MTFTNASLLLPILTIIAIYIVVKFKSEKKYFQWIEDHWFKKRTLKSQISSLLICIAIAGFVFSLMDIRGHEVRVQGKVGEQKTILLIDSSASMLAEDVRPNRFQKAIVLAKHYVKKSVGQKISIIVFSDSDKRIIPFTGDIDLLDARLSTLEELNLSRAGTGLSAAINQSVQYFVDSQGNKTGNIVVFTDAEETQDALSLELPDTVNLAIVGVGTAKGGLIPIRDNKGVFKGNKKFKGENVITRLDESFLKKIGDKIANYKYWVASSYSLPTEEIINFFNKSIELRESKNDFRVRPVLANYILIPSSILMIVGLLLGQGRTFLSVILFFSIGSYAQENKKEKKEKSQETLALEKALSTNSLPEKGKLKLAQKLLSEGFVEESSTLYEETLNDQDLSGSNKMAYTNWANAQVLAGKKKEGIEKYRKILKMTDKESELYKKVKDNLLKALDEETQQQKQKGDGESEDKKQSDDNQESDDSKSKEGKKGQDKNKESKSSGDKDQDENKDSEKDNNKEKETGKDKENKSDKQNDNSDESDKKEDKKNNASSGGQPKDGKPKKLPAILKQLMSDDNQLQKKLIDAKTTERKTRDKKDW